MAIQHIHTYCAVCASRCGVVATVEGEIFTKVTADPEHPNGCLCVKGSAAPELVYSPDRLSSPMRRTRPKGEPDPILFGSMFADGSCFPFPSSGGRTGWGGEI
jgi:anaerobic selenocysteine-containing dehydrogenase